MSWHRDRPRCAPPAARDDSRAADKCHGVGRLAQQAQSGCVGPGDFLEQAAVGLGIGAQTAASPSASKRARWRKRAASTRAAISALASLGGGRVRSEALTAGNSIWMSMRSSNGPEIRA